MRAIPVELEIRPGAGTYAKNTFRSAPRWMLFPVFQFTAFAFRMLRLCALCNQVIKRLRLALQKVAGVKGLSKDVQEVVVRALG